MIRVGKLTATTPDGQRHTYFLPPGTLTLGRSSSCDVVLLDPKVSRTHAQLDCSPENSVITDLDSDAGTLVNGERAALGIILQDGDALQMGDCKLHFRTGAAAADEEIDAEIMTLEAGLDPSLSDSATLESTLAEESVEHTVTDAAARLAICSPGRTREIPIPENGLTIGRGEENAVRVDDRRASREHAVVELRDDGKLFVQDLGSGNGTWIGERRIDETLLGYGGSFQIGRTTFVHKAPFRHEDLTEAEGKDAFDPDKHPVAIVPGLMGSELWKESEMIWPDLVTIYRRPEMLALPNMGLKPKRIAHGVVIVPNVMKVQAYIHLVHFLVENLGYQTGKNLLHFAYDWRQDNRHSARQLRRAIESWQEKIIGRDRKVTILAHGMGCLISRYYVERLGGARAVGKQILMGGPHHGSPGILHALVCGPRIFPLGLSAHRFQQTLLTYPSLYQILPRYPCVVDGDGETIDVYKDASWVNSDFRKFLKEGHEFRRELKGSTSVPTLCIYGHGIKTITRVVVDKKGENGWEKVSFITEKGGDGRIPESCAQLKGAEIFPVHQYHGALWMDRDVKMRLKRELVGAPRN
ncbi:MAG: FHA domain-containing protein [Planctomycetota bacterium]|jgi:pSer/pThr/pTyr-binding forkhead associated (FHA) protein